MRTLVIDSATEACSVALFEGGVLLGGELRMLGRGHAEQLVPMIAALPGKGRSEHIAVDVGPGSFTGIRVGLAAAKALALVWRAEVVGYGALALVAAMAGEEDVDVAMNGGHGEWFFRGAGNEAVRSLSPAAAASASRATLVAGSRAEELVALRGSGRAIESWPDARRFNVLARRAFVQDPRPAYGRAPDARLPAGT